MSSDFQGPFPEEIWIKILSQSRPRAFFSVARACKMLHRCTLGELCADKVQRRADELIGTAERTSLSTLAAVPIDSENIYVQLAVARRIRALAERVFNKTVKRWLFTDYPLFPEVQPAPSVASFFAVLSAVPRIQVLNLHSVEEVSGDVAKLCAAKLATRASEILKLKISERSLLGGHWRGLIKKGVLSQLIELEITNQPLTQSDVQGIVNYLYRRGGNVKVRLDAELSVAFCNSLLVQVMTLYQKTLVLKCKNLTDVEKADLNDLNRFSRVNGYCGEIQFI